MRNNEAVIFRQVYLQPPVLRDRVFQSIDRNNVIINLIIIQNPAGAFGIISFRAAPLSLCLIQYRRLRNVPRPCQYVTHPVHILHKHTERSELRISAARIKMRRAIRIGEPHRKRVRNKAVDPAHKHKVGQPLHHLYALCPAVCAENFAHSASFCFGTDMCVRRCKLRQRIVKEFIVAYPIADLSQHRVLCHAGYNLIKNHVHARNILTGDRAEVMTRPHTCF